MKKYSRGGGWDELERAKIAYADNRNEIKASLGKIEQMQNRLLPLEKKAGPSKQLIKDYLLKLDKIAASLNSVKNGKAENDPELIKIQIAGKSSVNDKAEKLLSETEELISFIENTYVLRQRIKAIIKDPDNLRIMLKIPSSDEDFSLEKEIDMGNQIIVRNHLFYFPGMICYFGDITDDEDLDEYKEYLSIMKDHFPKWPIKTNDIVYLDNLIEYAGGTYAYESSEPRCGDSEDDISLDESGMFADYWVQFEYSKRRPEDPFIVFRNRGLKTEKLVPIPPIGLLSLLVALSNAAFVPWSERQYGDEWTSKKNEVLELWKRLSEIKASERKARMESRQKTPHNLDDFDPFDLSDLELDDDI